MQATPHKVDDVEMKAAADAAPHTKALEDEHEQETVRAARVHRIDAVCDVFESGSGTD